MLSLKLVVNAQKARAVVRLWLSVPGGARGPGDEVSGRGSGHTCPEPQVRGHLCQAQPGPGSRQPCTQSPARLPAPHTDDSQVGAGSDAGDHIGGDALPLPVVLLAQGAELQAPAGQGIVLASAGLPYLGQTRGPGRSEGGGAGKKRSHQHSGIQERQGQHWAPVRSPPCPPHQESPSLLGPRPIGTAPFPGRAPTALPGSPGAQRYLPPRDDGEGVPSGGAGDEQLPAGLLPVLPAW